MALTNQNFSMFAGDTKTIRVTVTDVTGAPKDITGASITWAMQIIYGVDIKKSTTDGTIEIVNAVGGLYDISVIPSDTEGFAQGFYQHQSEVLDNDGISEVVLSGTVTINNSLF
jgi:hypothetical protein